MGQNAALWGNGFKQLKESMDMCADCHYITEILLKNSVKHQTINHIL